MEPGRFGTALQSLAHVGRDRVPVVQVTPRDIEVSFCVEDDEAGFPACLEASGVAAEARERGWSRAHPSDEMIQRVATPCTLSVHDGESERETGDASPGEVEAASVGALHLGWAGGVVGNDHIDIARSQRLPESFAVRMASD